MQSFKLVLLVLLATGRLGQSQTKQSALVAQGLESCAKEDSHLKQAEYNACLLNAVKGIQPLLSKGVAELGIPPLDPLVLQNINLHKSEPPVTLKALFSNVRISGLQNMDIKYLNVDIFNPQRKMSMGLTVPSMIMRGQYQMEGNIFLLPIEGQGNFIAKLDTVIVEGSANIVPTGQGHRTTTENVNVGFKIKDMAMKMDNLFEGNKILSDTMHHFLNENGQVVLEEIRPELTKTLNDLIAGLFTAIFDTTSSDFHAVHATAGRKGIAATAKSPTAPQ